MAHRFVESFFVEAEQVVPTLKAWRDRKLSSRWSNTAASQPAFDRADLNWCRDQARSDPTVEEFSGRAVLSQLSASAEGRLRKVAVGRQNDGTLDVEVRWVLSWFDLTSYSNGLTRGAGTVSRSTGSTKVFPWSQGSSSQRRRRVVATQWFRVSLHTPSSRWETRLSKSAESQLLCPGRTRSITHSEA